MNEPIIKIEDYLPLLNEYEKDFVEFEKLLIETNKRYNLTRIQDSKEIQMRHFMDSLIGLYVLDSISSQSRTFHVVDIGSGAGFPVLPLAIVRPQWNFLSIEATEKKCNFQKQVCNALGLDRVKIIHGRAESLGHDRQYREQFDCVISRAVADLSILAELSLGFVKPGGSMLAWKGPSVADELSRAGNTFSLMGSKEQVVYPYCLDHQQACKTETTREFFLLQAKKNNACPDVYPRCFSSIKCKPLGR